MSRSPGVSDELVGGDRRNYIRNGILKSCFEEAARQCSQEYSRLIVDGYTVTSPSIYVQPGPTERSKNEESQACTESKNPPRAHTMSLGGLSKADLKRFGTPPAHLTEECQNKLAHLLKTTLFSIAEVYSNELESENGSDAVMQLPERIRAQRTTVEREYMLSQQCRHRIRQLIHEINDIHPQLEDELIDSLSVLPPILNSTRSAQADLIGTTIDASLLKLSLIRTRAHIALYGHCSSSRPHASLNPALAAAQEKLRAKQRAQEEEGRELDAQISAYDGMLSLVGGREDGFAQVVEDMARVKRETDECKRDLRRLGWTGD